MSTTSEGDHSSEVLRESMKALWLELRCSICLSLLSDPVSLPCGHFFDRGCIEGVLKCKPLCPLCKATFTRRQLQPNPRIREVVSTFSKLHMLVNSRLPGLQPLSQSATPEMFGVNSKVEPPASQAMPKASYPMPATVSRQRRRQSQAEQQPPSEAREMYSDLDQLEYSSPPQRAVTEECLPRQDYCSPAQAANVAGISIPSCVQLWSPAKVTPEELSDSDRCHVCFEDSYEEDDPIVYCDRCDMAVHQSCYGIDVIPVGDWFCMPCEDEMKDVACAICPNKDDRAYRRTEEGGYIHCSCSFWSPHIKLEQSSSDRGIATGVPLIPKNRRNLRCSICNKPGYGMQCGYGRCSVSFHIPCAVRSNYILELREMDNRVFMHQFCPKHADLRGQVETNNSDPVKHRRGAGTCHSRKFPSRKRNQSRPASSGLGSARTMRRRVAQEPSGSEGPFVFLASALTYTEKECVGVLASVIDGKVLDDFDPSVTHVITHPMKRTTKVFFGILKGAWVLDYSWVTESLQAHRALAEEKFEISGDKVGTGAARQGRIAARLKKSGLFAKWSFVVPRFFEHTPALAEEVRVLLRTGQGGVLDHLPHGVEATELGVKLARTVLVYERSAEELSKRDIAFCLSHKVQMQPVSWIFDLISNFSSPPCQLPS